MSVDLNLPEGYSIEDAGPVLRLHDPEGELLGEEQLDPTAPSRLRDLAWRDVWTRVEREVNEDLRAVRAGSRALRDMRRLRQYLRMLDAVEQSPAVHEQILEQTRVQVHRSAWFSGLALAASAAAITVSFLTAQAWLGADFENVSWGTLQTVSSPAAVKPPAHQAGKQPARISSGTQSPAQRLRLRAARPSGVAQRPGLSARVAKSSAKALSDGMYAVGLGEFATRTAAEIRMHLIRSKGYVVHVIRIGDSYHVLTAPGPRWRAERLAAALQEIGLPARTQIVQTPQI